MKITRAIAVGAVLLTLGSLVIAWRQHRELQVLSAASARAESERTALRQRAMAAEQRAQELAAQLAAAQRIALSGATEAGMAGEGEAASSQASLAGNSKNLVENTMDRMKDPKVVQLMAARTKAQLALRYSGLFSQLKLTQEQGSKFMNLLVEKQSASLDVVTAAADSGITDMNEVGRMIAKTQNDLNQEIKATLGDAGYAQYQSFSQTQVQRDVISALQQSLGPSPSPLTNAQYQRMVQILGQTGPQSGTGATPSVSATGGAAVSNNPGGLITDATLAQAETALSPFQLKTLKGLQRAQQLDLALKLQLAKQGTPSAASGPGPK